MYKLKEKVVKHIPGNIRGDTLEQNERDNEHLKLSLLKDNHEVNDPDDVYMKEGSDSVIEEVKERNDIYHWKRIKEYVLVNTFARWLNPSNDSTLQNRFSSPLNQLENTNSNIE